MRDLKEAIRARERFLLDLIQRKQRALKGTPEGSCFTSSHRKTTQFFHRMPNGDRIYLKKDDKLIWALAQKEYDQNVLDAAEREIKQIHKLRSLYDDADQAEDQLGRMHPVKQPFVSPIVQPDGEYAREWLNKPFVRSDYHEEHLIYNTEKGEKVRSKSEVIIANLLRSRGIPYKYECPLTLRDSSVSPDFTILRIRDRKELYWEHLGRLDDPKYIARNHKKIRDYERAGIFPGTGLILSGETAAEPFDTRLAEQMIREYCL